jgi:hypothetical protein
MSDWGEVRRLVSGLEERERELRERLDRLGVAVGELGEALRGARGGGGVVPGGRMKASERLWFLARLGGKFTRVG